MADDEYLCSIGVLDDRLGNVHVYATREWLVIDKIPNPRKPARRERHRAIPMSDVRSVEIDAISGAHHEYGWSPATGFLNRGKSVAATTGILVELADGERILWRMNRSPIEVRSNIARFVEAVEEGARG
jgi:hypothetical protein